MPVRHQGRDMHGRGAGRRCETTPVTHQGATCTGAGRRRAALAAKRCRSGIEPR
jgi:hypothetical protein